MLKHKQLSSCLWNLHLRIYSIARKRRVGVPKDLDSINSIFLFEKFLADALKGFYEET